MRIGLHKQDKTTGIFFDEASPIIKIHTHNTSLKNRLTYYSKQFPDICELIDEDPEQGYMSFRIPKGRFCFRLTAPYGDDQRKKASKNAKCKRKKLQTYNLALKS